MTWLSNLRNFGGSTSGSSRAGNSNERTLISLPEDLKDSSELDDPGLANLEPSHVQSASRVFLVELVGSMVVFIVCTLVCLQMLAIAQVTLEKSRAMSSLGQTGVSITENWKAGLDLDALCQRFGGTVDGDQLILLYNRSFQLTDDLSQARYRLVFSAQSDQRGISTGSVSIYFTDELLLEWQIGRFDPYLKSVLGG